MIPKPLQDAVRDLLACPSCGGALETRPPDDVACAACGRVWPVVEGVLDFLATPVQRAPQEHEP